ncbi:hypothetical protein AVEN_1613-1 [Araneus ventricosus]|uniref:Uncharacterized protein n=1 Tax=Araneus ventricosus TaxID=182803 RepID=A0A4Y2W5P5_ARAVE|nr:hypothetical protein AVEN_1613-1 [Araneus ventricosus]
MVQSTGGVDRGPTSPFEKALHSAAVGRRSKHRPHKWNRLFGVPWSPLFEEYTAASVVFFDKLLETAKMRLRSDLLKWRRNRAAAQRQIREEEKNEKKDRAERYYEKNKQKKNCIENYFQINEGASTSGVSESQRVTSVT